MDILLGMSIYLFYKLAIRWNCTEMVFKDLKYTQDSIQNTYSHGYMKGESIYDEFDCIELIRVTEY